MAAVYVPEPSDEVNDPVYVWLVPCTRSASRKPEPLKLNLMGSVSFTLVSRQTRSVTAVGALNSTSGKTHAVRFWHTVSARVSHTDTRNWSTVHRLQAAQARSVSAVGALVSYCEAVQAVVLRHTVSADVLQAETWNCQGWQTVHGAQSVSWCPPHAERWNVTPLLQAPHVPQVVSAVALQSLWMNRPLVQARQPLHTVLFVSEQADAWKCDPLGQTVHESHCRSKATSGATSWYWLLLQTVRLRHTASAEILHKVEMY
jgi:hypothetical protein